MQASAEANSFREHTTLVQVAREIAIDHKPIDDILKEYSISAEEWSSLKANDDFIRLLNSEIVAWQSAQNTHERLKLKAAALLEEWLIEANARLYDPQESLSAKTELAKLISRIAEVGDSGGGDGSGKFNVTINLGADAQLKFEKQLPTKVIDVTPQEAT